MTTPALLTTGSKTRVVAQLRAFDALTEGLRVPPGPLALGSAWWSQSLLRQVPSLSEDFDGDQQPDLHNPSVDLAGLPVVVVGGLASNPHVLIPLRDWLRRLGCLPLLPPAEYGIGCGQRGAIAVEQALAGHVDATGEPAVIIAHSRGGQFARPVAVRRPELLRGLITLGSPLNRLLGVRPSVLVKVLGLGVGGSLGVPSLFRASCLWGQCCRPLREDLWGPFPDQVPFVSVFSRHDEVVFWQASLDPAARHREIVTTHRGLITSPAALRLIADELTGLVQHQHPRPTKGNNTISGPPPTRTTT